MFGGALSNQIICDTCGFVSERDEQFHTLALDIKGKSSIIDALASYVAGEKLTGSNQYFCSQCQVKVGECSLYTASPTRTKN